MTRWAQAFRDALPRAVAVMLAYLSIGLPCGVMESMIGLSPLLAFVLSATFYTGAGQFMIPKMWLAGTPLAAIATTVSFTNTRQILYSTAFAPYFAQVKRGLALVFSATVTDESFGVNIERFENDPTWDARRATALNICCMLSWASANALGCALGPIVNLPTALMSFAMTSIFLCLTVGQLKDAITATVMIVAAAGVMLLKTLGFSSVAVLGGAVTGVVAGVAREGFARGGDGADEPR